MCWKNLNRIERKVSVLAAVSVLALGATNVRGDAVLVEPVPHPSRSIAAHAATLPMADLERAFWICDHIATTRGMDAAPAEICGAVYEALKAKKFGGDFEQLLAWWRQNKPAEHEKVAGGNG